MKRPNLDPQELYEKSIRPHAPNPDTEPYWLKKIRERKAREGKNRVYRGKNENETRQPF